MARTAARIGIALAAGAFPAMTGLLETRLSGDPGPSSADLSRATGLIERTLDYFTSAVRPVSSRRTPAP